MYSGLAYPEPRRRSAHLSKMLEKLGGLAERSNAKGSCDLACEMTALLVPMSHPFVPSLGRTQHGQPYHYLWTLQSSTGKL